MPDPTKERDRASWATAAAGWAKHDDRLIAQGVELTPRMLDAARLGPGMRVLDLASGTGQPALPAAERVGPTGAVLATDLVEEMIAFAREKAARLGLRNIEFRCVDAEELDVPVAAFDAVTCRWGVMFMADAVGCLRRVHAALRPGGRVALTAWAEPERNPWAALPVKVISRYVEVPRLPPGAPGMFAFADPARLRATLVEAGFGAVEIEEVTLTMGGEFPSGDHWAAFTLEMSATMSRLVATLPADTQAALRGEMAREAEAFCGGRRVALPGVTWLASATR